MMRRLALEPALPERRPDSTGIRGGLDPGIAAVDSRLAVPDRPSYHTRNEPDTPCCFQGTLRRMNSR